MTPSDNFLVIEPMGKFQAFLLKMFGYVIGLRGNPYLVFIENQEIANRHEMSINDIKRAMEEDEANSVRTQTTNRMESGE